MTSVMNRCERSRLPGVRTLSIFNQSVSSIGPS